MLMKKNHLLAMMKLCLLFSAGIFVVSCADTYDGNDTFESNVKNATLESPKEADITVTASTDGSTMTIEWPVVYGAGGYEFKLLNASDEETPLISKTIDGCKVTVSREEDMNYKILIRTLGNASLNNTEAPTATTVAYSTFTETYAKIPEGDLYEYFQKNPIPDTETEDLNFDLTPNGEYTLSQPLEFNYHKVVLRTSDKTHHATITLAADANFVASNDFTLKYVNIDARAITKPVIEAYNYDTAPDGILEKPGNYYLIDFVRIMDCAIAGVVGSLFYDNNKAYGVVNFLIKNSIIQLTTTTDKIKNQAWISFQGGGVKDFSMSNSTIFQMGDGNPQFFLRYNNSIRVDRLGWTKSDHTTITYTNNTFYKVGSGNWSNYSGMADYSVYNVQNNIWYACGNGQIARRILGNGRLGTNASATWNNNTYWNEDGQVDQGTYDTGTVLTTNPDFENPAEVNFTPRGAEQVEKKTGDPRWYATKATE